MLHNFSELFQTWLQEYFDESAKNKNFVELLFKSQQYSLQAGGKKFRPYLAMTVFKIWKTELQTIKNFCLAIEMIHTYSLIHDDLPCMDNDDLRRGKATNHKIFGEDIALLAGDALLTEAFRLIASEKTISADVRIQVIAYLSEKIGSFGMVGGQVLDMKADSDLDFNQLKKIHQMKTGCLIQASAVGAALIASANAAEVDLIAEFAENLGLAFQIKDDLLDFQDSEQDFKNFVSIIGLQKAEDQLQLHSKTAYDLLQHLQKNPAVDELRALVTNQNKRTM